MNHRIRTLALVGLALLGPLLPASARPTKAPPSVLQDGLSPAEQIEQLLERIEDEGDKVDPRCFDDLAQVGTPEAFAASLAALGEVKKEGHLNRAYGALVRYTDRGLRDQAMALLSKDSWRHRRAFNRRAAARGLVAFGDEARGALLELARTHKDDDVRALAIWPVLGALAEGDTVADLELMLELATAQQGARLSQLRETLVGFGAAPVVARMAAGLEDEDTPLAWRELLLERLGDEPGELVEATLVRVVGDDDPGLALAAMEAVGRRGLAVAEAPLRRHLRSKEGALVRAAIEALAGVVTDHAAWREELAGFATDKRPAARIGAAVALADLRSGPALELLHGLVADPDHAVRAVALQQVANLRRADGIGLLIGRLEVETGVMHARVVNLLRLMTGEDFGTGSRWARWWDDVGATFEVPSYEAALAAERARASAREEGGTQASFYGLRIVSDRVTFILDTSGSMSAAAKAPGERSTTGGADSTRIEIAKDQLARAISRLPDGDLFNMIFFAGGVRPWQEAVTKMTKGSRAQALEYVARQEASGGTAVYDALESAFEDERVDTIFLLTDGSPSAGKIQDEGRIAQAIARLNSVRMVQINCISVGRSSVLLRRLAEESGGTYREVL